MAKLIDILARELKEWPADCTSNYCVQSDETTMVFFGGPAASIRLSERADKTDGVKVTREEWQAAVEALKAPAVDWSKAPERATHYFINSPNPWRDCSGENWWFLSSDGNWKDSQATSARILERRSKDLIPRPAAPAWNGEGLPPVGVECLTDHRGETFSVKVLAYADKGGKQAVMVERTSHPEFGCLHAWMAHMCNFQPIKTAEQIAAEERQAGIDELVKVLNPYIDACLTITQSAEALYDAGYRKQ